VSEAARWSFVIPARDTPDLVVACVASIRRLSSADIVVVDDGGEDRLSARLAQTFLQDRSLRTVRLETSRGFSGAANRGLEEVGGEVLVCLNSDTELLGGSLDGLDAAFHDEPRLGIAGAALSYPDGRDQWSGGREPDLPWLVALASGLGASLGELKRHLGRRGDRIATAGEVRRVDWVSGAALAIRRDCWATCGPLSDDFAFYAQDLDLCCRARDSGYEVGIAREFRVIHHHGATIAGNAPRAAQGAPAQASQRIDLLWSDLLRWYRARHGSDKARRAAWAMRLVARARRLGTRHATTRAALARAIERIAADQASPDRAARPSRPSPPQTPPARG
jgi:GT2 family glycosyltransferase